jgi:calcineurin-like phosphoesterase family protein
MKSNLEAEPTTPEKKMGKIYLITDTHFNHANMVQYCGRPKNFSESIGLGLLTAGFTKDDVLVHLGDVCIGKDAETHAKYIEPLKCKKWLLRGNHDKKSNSWYLSHGWDFIGETFVGYYFGKNIMFSHTPQKGDFDLNIHGHFHNNLHRLLEGRYVVEGEEERNREDLLTLTPKHKLLAIEETNYKPVLLNTFISKDLL